MLNQYGERCIGHGVIKEFSEEIMISQLEKRKFNLNEYDELILSEFRHEQPSLFRLLENLAGRYATQYADKELVSDTEQWDDCVSYWKQRLMFVMAFQYKILSVGLECQQMEES